MPLSDSVTGQRAASCTACLYENLICAASGILASVTNSQQSIGVSFVNGQGLLVAAINAVVVLILARPVGSYLARTFCGEPTRLGRALRPLEHGLCRLADVPSGPGIVKEPARMSWPSYLLSLLAFNGALVLILMVLRQGSVLLSGRADQAATFLESAQRLIRLFASAATGLTLVIALARALRRRTADPSGNFWVDLFRGTLYLLLPLCVLVGLWLAPQGMLRALVAWLFAHPPRLILTH
ncbi:MAG: potassium-transporting ATPase subunit KdpA [Polyangia bacterium]